jgi:hypothetical protein|tara:strand:+ start:556 stop:783 length:228 start_codon:yes stop_codon:yes gene_type:complete
MIIPRIARGAGGRLLSRAFFFVIAAETDLKFPSTGGPDSAERQQLKARSVNSLRIFLSLKIAQIDLKVRTPGLQN